jgi:hypothetical protein
VIESILARGPVQSQDEHAFLHLRRNRRELHPSQTSFPFVFFLLLLFSGRLPFSFYYFSFLLRQAAVALRLGTLGHVGLCLTNDKGGNTSNKYEAHIRAPFWRESHFVPMSKAARLTPTGTGGRTNQTDFKSGRIVREIVK